jgi:hypothetical protein
MKIAIFSLVALLSADWTLFSGAYTHSFCAQVGTGLKDVTDFANEHTRLM